jgi:PAS domain S-box-containing protein
MLSRSGLRLPHERTPLAMALRDGAVRRGEDLTLERPDGTLCEVLASVQPLQDGAGRPAGAVICFEVAPERRGDQAPPRREDEDHRQVLDALPAAVYATDAEGRVTYANRAASELAGREPKLGEDRWCVSWKLRDADGAPLALEDCPMAVTLREGRPVRNVQVFAERPDGACVPVMPYPTPLFDSEGALAGAVNILVDISPLKRAEAAERKRADQQGALYRFTNRLYRAATQDDIMEAALDAIIAALGCSRAAVLMFDGDGVMRFAAQRGLSEAYRAGVEGHSPWTLQDVDPQPICVSDADALEAPLRDVVSAEGIGALAFVPLTANGRLIGKFMAYHDAPHDFSGEELDFAVTIARQLGFSITRARAAEALSASEERYRAVVESQAEMVCRFGADGEIMFANGAYAQAVGAAPEALVGAKFWDFIAEADRPAARAAWDALTPDAPEARTETRIGGSSEERWTLWTFRALSFGADGAAAEVQSTGVDIKERKRAEHALIESEERFRLMSENAPVMIWISDASGACLHLNRVQRAFWNVGESLEDFDWGATMHPEDAPEMGRRVREALATRSEFAGEARYRNAAGEYRVLHTQARPRLSANGELLGMIGVNVDVTDHKKAQELREVLISIVESSEDAIVSKDLNGVVVSWNEGAERLFGYAPEEIIGRPISMLMPVDHEEEEWGILERIRRGDRIKPYETVRRRKDGSLVDISLTVSPVKDASGKIVGASKIARDISGRKRAEEQRTLLINELNHRVKNTLATVQSLAMQTLRNTERSADARHAFEARLAALSRAHDVLTSQNWEGAHLRVLVERALEPFQTAELRFALEGPQVRLSPKQALAVSMALHELATNAVKYGALGKEAGRVRVEWRIETQHAAPAFELVWTETGGPEVSRPTRSGFGTRLIERNLANDLGAAASIEYRPEGVVAIIRSPLETPRMAEQS